ncbi:gamma-glutamylcyclotransferase [Thalassococcus sp. CAU 1522]|uniref:Putative gamma-glutamylcyclotransferase n=1 Tax=Thalassococcus arenae TaxID=2851652 RepID=A0ABS6NAZ0_9RHOB|nr:gamma-glutamylcyclotransferase [Thalassococcus arenae]MBV2361175.1 gamma-glutamylcyclotransferase [Thalassococcus arenae]
MPDLFVYGTLRHLPLLETVLGRGLGRDATCPATLRGYAVSRAKDQPFPMIATSAGGCATGVVLRGPTETDLNRLDYFEGGFGYDRVPVDVETAEGPRRATVYVPRPGLWQAYGPWDLDGWVRDWGQVAQDAADEIMRHYGRTPSDRMQALRPFLYARAWARSLAETPAPQTLRSAMTAADVEVLRDRAGFDGFFRIRAFDLRHRRFDGTTTDPVSREGFVAFDAALVIPYDPATDRLLLIEQLRYGPLLRGDPAPWVLEPIAGLVDAGENPADCARREAVEEAGITLTALEPMTRVYASPGYSSEFFHCFLGLCDLSDHSGGLGGLDSENEDIRSHVIAFDRAMALIDSGEINAGPLAMMLLWLARHRDRLRASA